LLPLCVLVLNSFLSHFLCVVLYMFSFSLFRCSCFLFFITLFSRFSLFSLSLSFVYTLSYLLFSALFRINLCWVRLDVANALRSHNFFFFLSLRSFVRVDTPLTRCRFLFLV
jgi:hypothetical protein